MLGTNKYKKQFGSEYSKQQHESIQEKKLMKDYNDYNSKENQYSSDRRGGLC